MPLLHVFARPIGPVRTLLFAGLVVGGALGLRALSGAWSPAMPEPMPELEPPVSSVGPDDSTRDSPAKAELDPGLFCRGCSAVAKAATPPAQTSTLPLKLLATLEASDPSESMATVVHLPSSAVAAYVPGEEILPGVRLESVLRGRAYVKKEGALEVLSIEAPSVQTREESPAPETQPAVQCEGEGPCRLSRQWVRALVERPGELAKQARVVPKFSDGEVLGYKVYGVRPRSVLARLGIESGDTIESVNGVRLYDLDVLMGLYGQLETRDEWQVTIQRKGEALERRFLLD